MWPRLTVLNLTRSIQKYRRERKKNTKKGEEDRKREGFVLGAEGPIFD